MTNTYARMKASHSYTTDHHYDLHSFLWHRKWSVWLHHMRLLALSACWHTDGLVSGSPYRVPWLPARCWKIKLPHPAFLNSATRDKFCFHSVSTSVCGTHFCPKVAMHVKATLCIYLVGCILTSTKGLWVQQHYPKTLKGLLHLPLIDNLYLFTSRG